MIRSYNVLAFDMDDVLADVDRRAMRGAIRLASRLGTRWSRVNEPDVQDVEDALTRLLQDAMIEAHLRAQRLYGLHAALSSRPTTRILLKATPEEKAALRKLYGSVAKSATRRSMSRVRDVLLANVVEGRGRRASVKKALNAAGVSDTAKHLVKTLTRTQTSLAFNAAAWQASMERDDVWGFQYVTARDERVRRDHRFLEGARYPKNHRFWAVYAPPNGWNCRCVLRPISRKSKIKPPKQRPEIDVAFRLNPGRLVGISTT